MRTYINVFVPPAHTHTRKLVADKEGARTNRPNAVVLLYADYFVVCAYLGRALQWIPVDGDGIV